MTLMMSKALEPRNDDDLVPALDFLSPGEQLGAGDLPQIRIPAGGWTSWELPDGSSTKQLRAVIAARRLRRVYWSTPMGSDDGAPSPDCYSSDGVTGIGEPGGECAACPYAAFGSAPSGRGQACRQITDLVIVLDGAATPLILVLPPSAMMAVRRYLTGIVALGRHYRRVVTVITLERVTNPAGIVYSRPVFTAAAEPPAPQSTAAADQIAEAFTRQ